MAADIFPKIPSHILLPENIRIFEFCYAFYLFTRCQLYCKVFWANTVAGNGTGRSGGRFVKVQRWDYILLPGTDLVQFRHWHTKLGHIKLGRPNLIILFRNKKQYMFYSTSMILFEI